MFELEVTLENGTLTLRPKGRVSSVTAPQFDKEALAAAASASRADIVIDAADLEYISSAGLRVFMKLRKCARGDFSVINVSPEVYETLEITGFTLLLNVHQR